MPTYEYACRACGHRFDIVQKMSDDPLVICPECGGELRKVFTAPAISFKGSGFYATDHGKKSKSGSDKAGSGSDRDAGDTTEKKAGPGDKEKKTETASTSERSQGSGSKDTKKPSAPRKEDS